MDFITRTATDLSATGRTIHGIVAPFNTYAMVHDTKGPSRPYEERIAPGAFTRSIRERGHKVVLVHEHLHQTTMPIGKATKLEERGQGLYAEFTVARTDRGEEALQLVKDGIMTGFSIRAGIGRSKNDSRTQVTRHELALADVSLTTSPVYDSAGVAGVRSQNGDPDDELLMSTEFAIRLLAYRSKVRA